MEKSPVVGNINPIRTWSQVDLVKGESSVFEPDDSLWKITNTKELLKRLDRNLMPIICVLYLLLCLDSSNLDNAAENGLIKDLNMTGKDDFNVRRLFFSPSFHVLLFLVFFVSFSSSPNIGFAEKGGKNSFSCVGSLPYQSSSPSICWHRSRPT